MAKDPTFEDMIEFLKKTYKGLIDVNSYEEFTVPASIAIYWFGSAYHGGQWSNLYSALCQSEYRPGRMMNDVSDETEDVTMMYNSLSIEFGDGEQIESKE